MTTPTDEDLSAGTPVEHGPQVARYGLRTDGPILRADLSAAVPTHANEAQTVYNLDFVAACALTHTRIETRLHFDAGNSCSRLGLPLHRQLRR